MKRLRMECTDLAVRIAAHPHWETVEAEKRLEERMRLKQATLLAAAPVVNVDTAA